jgi:hypothetical protein
VVNEFRLRCCKKLGSHLKEMDLELQRIVTPLVPSTVMEENIKYRPMTATPVSSQASRSSQCKARLSTAILELRRD